MNAEANNIETDSVPQPSSMGVVGESQKSVEQEQSPLLTPGQRLRAAREAEGLTQEDISAELRLDLKLIRALEEGDLEHLPEPVFTAGYLRSYARLVGLPADELVTQYVQAETRDLPPLDSHRGELSDRYRKVAHALPNSFSLSTGQHNKTAKSSSQAVLILGAILIVLAAFWATKTWLSSRVASLTTPSQTAPLSSNTSSVRESSAQAIPSKTKSTADMIDEGISARRTGDKGKPASKKSTKAVQKKPKSSGNMIEKSLPIKPLPGSGNAPQVQGKAPGSAKTAIDLTQLSLRFSDTSWVDIRDATGKRLIRELGLKGATKKIAGVAPFSVLLGYGPGVEIAYNGKPFDFSKYQGDRIARFTLHLKDDHLKAKPEVSDGLPDDKAPLPEPED